MSAELDRQDVGEDHFNVDTRTVVEWLKRWDEGAAIWSVEMGGLGPTYEQCLQIAVVEIVRHMTRVGYNAQNWTDEKACRVAMRDIESWAANFETMRRLRLSYAQWMAALQLARHIYAKGPADVLNEPWARSRRIQITKFFPHPYSDNQDALVSVSR